MTQRPGAVNAMTSELPEDGLDRVAVTESALAVPSQRLTGDHDDRRQDDHCQHGCRGEDPA